MISKKLVFFAIFIHFTTWIMAQTLEQRLTTWAQQNPIEKVYLHLDRESYIAGQSIWFKGYFLSDFIPSIKNSTIYAELIDNKSNVVVRKTFPSYFGVTLGQIELPENFLSGSYQIRAYSPLMLNQPGFVYSKRIFIFGTEPKETAKDQKPPALDLQFFPEGGNLITSLLNTVAFKAVDQNGFPVSVSGQLKNNKGEVITSFSSKHDGMGEFTLVPLAAETYFVVLDNDAAKQYPLPASTTQGLPFSIRTTPKGNQFKIEQLDGAPEFRAAYMIGQMENTIIFKQNLQEGKNLVGGIIQTTNLLSGILQVTVFNKNNMPLAERLTFIDNKEYVLPGELIQDTINTGSRQRNRFSIALKDTIIGNFSVAVTDADYEPAAYRPVNIYSYFLLNSDLKGYVHNPAYYFNSDADSVKAALDLVMMTNGWSRFNWTDVVKNTLPAPLYKDPGFITLKGKINIEGTKKPFASKDLIMMTSPVDTLTQGKGGQTKMINTDSLGNFKLDSMILFEKTRVLFSDVRGKKSKFIKIKMSEDSIRKKYEINPLNLPYKDTVSAETADKMLDAYNSYLKAEGVTLSNVTVRGRQKSDREKLEDEYTSGLFSGGIDSKVLDLTKEVAVGGNIFDYIQSRIPGVTVSRDNEGQYVVNYRSFGSGNKMALFLDEVPTDAPFIEGVPIEQIAMVKVMGNFVGTSGGGSALAIYTKKGADLNASIESATDIITYNGYSIIKEFYQPNYDTNPGDKAKPDNRLTLLWNPDIYLANISPKVPIVFYNNDQTKRFKVVVEGVTNDGRFLMIEKTINPGP